MTIFFIFAGLFAIIIGVYILRVAREIPEDEVTRRGFATYWSRDTAYFLAVVVMLMGVLLAMLGAVF